MIDLVALSVILNFIQSYVIILLLKKLNQEKEKIDTIRKIVSKPSKPPKHKPDFWKLKLQ